MHLFDKNKFSTFSFTDASLVTGASWRSGWFVLGLGMLLSACPANNPSTDAGVVDAGSVVVADAGLVAVDSGSVLADSGVSDSGVSDSGALDAGPVAVVDAGALDAGPVAVVDAGEQDAGAPVVIVNDEAGEFNDPLDVTLPLHTTVSIQEEREQDCFRFSTATGGILRAETSDGAGGCSGDSKISLYVNAETSPAFENDDGGEGLCALLEDLALPPGSYTVCAFAFSDRLLSDVAVDVVLDEYICGDFNLDPGEECDHNNDDGTCNAQCLLVDDLERETEPNDFFGAAGILTLPLDEKVRGNINNTDDVDLWQISLPGEVRPGALSIWLGGLDADSEDCGSGSDLRMSLSTAVSLGQTLATSVEGDRCRAMEISRINGDFIFGDETFTVEVKTLGRPAPYTLYATYIEGICGNGIREPSEACEMNEPDADQCDPLTCQRIVPENDICYRATELLVTADGELHEFIANTNGATDSAGFSCQGGTAENSDRDADLFFTFTAPVTGNYLVEARSDGWNHILAAGTGSCSAFTELACANLSSSPLETLEISLEAGQQIWIAVDAYSSAKGEVTIGVGLLLPPDNDTCATATELAALLDDGSILQVQGNLRAATNTYLYEGVETCTSNSAETRDVFYSFTAPSTGTVEAWVRSNQFNAALIVENATCDGATACSASGLQLLDVVAGETYKVVIDSVDNRAGSYELDLRYVIAPANEICANASSLTLTGDGIQVVAGDTLSANKSTSLSCAANSVDAPDVFYHVVITEESFVTFKVAAEYSFAMALLTACDGVESQCTEAVRGDAEIAGTFSAGEYWLVIDGNDALERGAFTLTVQKRTLVQPGETCADATLLSATTGSLGGDLSNYSEDINAYDLGKCTPELPYSPRGRDGTFAIDVAAGETLEVTANASEADVILYLLEDCVAADACLTGVDDVNNPRATEFLSWTNTGTARRVFIVVDEWRSANGSSDIGLFELDWSLWPASDGGMSDAGVPDAG